MAEVSQAQTAHALNRIADSAEVIEYYLFYLVAAKSPLVPPPAELRKRLREEREKNRLRGGKLLWTWAG